MEHFDNIRTMLKKEGMDAVALTEEANRFYAAGFPSTGSDGLAVVTAEAAYYFTDARYIEAAQKAVQGAHVALMGRGRGYLQLLREVIDRHGVKRMGFDDGAMTVADYECYRQGLSCTLCPASRQLTQLRQVKDPEEIAAIEAAQRITEQAYAAIVEEIRPGVSEREIAARLQYLMLHFGAEKMSFDPIVVSGPNGSVPHGVPTDRPIGAGEFVTMDFGCIFHGYCSDMTRTVAVGSVTEEMERVYDTVLQAQKAGIAAVAAGVSGAAVDGAARQVIADAGYGAYFTHSFGHGVGVEIHESPNASPAFEAPLPAGAVISAEPGIYLPGKLGVRIEDLVVVTAEGCRNLTRAPKELTVL